MSKQELLDKAVERFKGNAKEISSNYGRDGYTLIYHADNIYGICHVESYYADGVKYVLCSIDEFTQRARELGWINGYKWGVEYPTNGKKPDLPGDLNVIVKYENGWRQDNDGTDIVEEWAWSSSMAFKIIDQRYKPVEVEQAQADWYDYDKQQAIALPPVEAKCLCWFDDGRECWHKCDVIGSIHAERDNGYVAVSLTGSHERRLIWANQFRPLDYNRKDDEEKRAFVEAALGALGVAECTASIKWIENLYNAGCRFK